MDQQTLEYMTNDKKEVLYDTLGIVKYCKKRGIRRLSISVKPFKGVVVTMPFTVSYSEAEKFVLGKSDWIASAKEKMRQIEAKKTYFTETTVFHTQKHTLAIKRSETQSTKLTSRISSDKITVILPIGIDILLPQVQDFIAATIERAWRIEAKEHIPTRVAELAHEFGFTYSGVAIKRIKSRWGSCSYTNNINLSIYLMQLPLYLVDYVILHELSHTIQKNHGPKFWALLDKVTQGNARSYAAEMKKFSTRFF